MRAGPDVTQLLVRPRGGSPAARARRRRHEQLVELFPNIDEMRVLDLGGEAHTWLTSTARPRQVVLLNIPWQAKAQQERLDADGHAGWMQAVAGDVCDPPDELRHGHFDLIYSNSVIEHLGGHQRREAFAWFVHTLGDHHWVQTPNRYFPVEPHWLFPAFQFLPPRVRARMTVHWPIGGYTKRRGPLHDRLRDVLDVELLSSTHMRFYFPTSRILRERTMGLTKSLIAVR